MRFHPPPLSRVMDNMTIMGFLELCVTRNTYFSRKFHSSVYKWWQMLPTLKSHHMTKRASEQNMMEILCDDVLVKIMSHLDEGSILAVSKTCRGGRRVTNMVRDLVMRPRWITSHTQSIAKRFNGCKMSLSLRKYSDLDILQTLMTESDAIIESLDLRSFKVTPPIISHTSHSLTPTPSGQGGCQ